jgi:type I restriction enzyme M protein
LQPPHHRPAAQRSVQSLHGHSHHLLFFTKGQPTTEIWYYEHPYPPGSKSYNKGKPIRIEEFEAERAWWDNRVDNEQAWRVSIDQIKAGNYNLDLKNPHNPDTGPGDVDHLLPEYEKILAQIAATRAALKKELHHALTATAGTGE